MNTPSPLSDAASTDIAQHCDKKAYDAPCLRDLDKVDITEGGTQPNPFESLNGVFS